MSKITNDIATINILSNIKDKKSSSINNIKNEKNYCIAAVRYNTIGNAYRAIKTDHVYLVKDDKNGNSKIRAYSRCSKTIQKGEKYCHLHCRMTKYNNDGLKIFDKDILPLDSKDKTRWLASIDDEFFENMGKRGAKKKYSNNIYSFTNENNPVLLILNHKNAKLAVQLEMYASQLLKNNNIVYNDNINLSDNNKKSLKSKDDSLNNINNLISMISTIQNKSKNQPEPVIQTTKNDSEHESEDESEDGSEEESEEASEDGSEEESEDGSENDSKDESEVIVKSSYVDDNLDNRSDNGSDNGSDNSISCIPIYTNTEELLWYNEDNKTIYLPDGEDGGQELGILTEISNKYHTIKHNDKLYTVLKEIHVNNRGNVYCCVLTDSLFNESLKCIGTRIKIKNNDYRFEFKK